MRNFAFARALLLGSTAALGAAPALAQTVEETTEQAADQPPAPEATAATNDGGADTAQQEIVVTARRTEENVQRVPSSISAFNERTLDRIQASDTTGLQGAVPNLNIVQGRGSSNATNIFIRGIGQPDALQTFDPAVGVYVDDVYLSRIRGNQLDLLDVERIEVLRGPQGTLYGKNTIGGAIKFVSRRPGKEFRANGSVAYGSYDQLELKGAVSGPISETLSAGFAVMRAKRDGYVEDRNDDREYNDKDTVAGRAALAFTPSDRVRIDLTADYSHDDARLAVGRPVNDLTTFSFGFFPDQTLPVTDPVGSGSYDWSGATTPGLPNSTKLTHYGFAGTMAFDIADDLTVKSITAYRKLKTDDFVDIDATEYELGDVFVGVDQKQFSQEFQLAYTGERLSALAGLYYLKEDIQSHQEAYADDLLGPLFANLPFTRFVDDDLTTKSYAAFANASYEVLPAVRVSAGLRYTKETKDYFRSTFRCFGAACDLAPFVFNPDKGKWSDWSPMASIDWQVRPRTMIYARVAKGFKSGGFNGRANEPGSATEYQPETTWSYEAGFKSTIADRLRLNGAIFHSEYKDFQARVSGPPSLGGDEFPSPVLAVVNAGKLRIRGAELEASWNPMEQLLLDTQIGYLDADYKEFFDDRFPNDSRAFQAPAFSPKWTMRFGGQYGFDLGSSGAITIGAQTRYKSRTALAVDNTLIIYANFADPGTGTTSEVDGLFQKAYWVHDARIVYETENKRLAIGLYGNNLSDRAYKTDAQEFSNIGSIRTVYYGPPRTVTLRLTARY